MPGVQGLSYLKQARRSFSSMAYEHCPLMIAKSPISRDQAAGHRGFGIHRDEDVGKGIVRYARTLEQSTPAIKHLWSVVPKGALSRNRER